MYTYMPIAALIPVLVLLTILSYGIYTLGAANFRSSRKIKAIGPKLTEQSVLPHEVFPELLYWEVGDKFYLYPATFEYLGILDGVIKAVAVKITTTGMGYRKGVYEVGKIFNFDPDELSVEAENLPARVKFLEFQKSEIASQVNGDSYMAFCKELREVNTKYLAS